MAGGNNAGAAARLVSALLVALPLLAAGEDPYRFFTWTVTYGDIYPLGVKQQGILINNQFPGPQIEAVTNDNLIINVHNNLTEPFLLSWSGLQQRRNSFEDGVGGTTCPIPPGANFTYILQAKDQIGTYYYFPSLAFHKAAGAFGGIRVLSRPMIPVPFPPPAADYTALVGDWYKANHHDLKKVLDSGKALGFPDGLLINGRSSGYTFTVQPGRTYRFRITNVGLATSLNVRFQGHTMKLVEVEGSHTMQTTYASLDVHLGQSYSVLVTADQPAFDYALLVSTRFTAKVVSATAVLRYANSAGKAPGPLPGGPTTQIDWSLNQARSVRWNLTASGPRPNPQGSYHYGLVPVQRTITLANSAAVVSGKQRYAVNRVSYVSPDTPLKLADYYKIPGVFNVGTISDSPSSGGAYLQTSVMGANYRDYVEIVFQNDENEVQSWHIDGYAFWVVGMDGGKWSAASRQGYNLRDGVSRYTVQVLEVTPSVNEKCSNMRHESTSSTKLTFPPASTVKQLVAAIENGKNFKSVNDMKTNGDQMLKEKGGLSLSVVKSLVRREKEERSSSEFFGDEETQSLMYSLFKLEEQFPPDGNQHNPEYLTSLSKDLHGAPPGSFIHHLAQVIGSISSVHKMAFFWQSVVLELRKLWSDWQPVPRMPLDSAPDLNCCLLHQEIQVINCCVARKKRREAAKESMDCLLKRASINNSKPRFSNGESHDKGMYARDSTGDYILRLGANCLCENLTLLETGEPIYSPILQEGPIMTAELIKETEELVLRTGSLGAGCSQLLSDMQAFKAANPGCVLEDFIRWHSPPDWSEDCAASTTTVGEGSSRRGRLSDRMQTKEGNLWKELWETAKPIPAVEQTPIYDEDLAVESIFDALEVIEPAKLFEQLLAVILSVCFVTAESVLPADNNLSKLFFECKDYITDIYQDEMSKEKLDEICKVYETMEAIVTHPEEALQIMDQPDEKSVENKNRFKLKLSFLGKDRPPLWKRGVKDEKKTPPKDERNSSEEKNTKIFSNLLDRKVSIFIKKNAKSPETPPQASPSDDLGPLDESEWTIL